MHLLSIQATSWKMLTNNKFEAQMEILPEIQIAMF